MFLNVAISVVVGISAGLGWWYGYRPVVVGLGRRLLRPSLRKPGKRWLYATQFVLSGQLPLAIWMGLLLPAPLTQLTLSLFMPGWVAAIGGVLAMGGAAAEWLSGQHKLGGIERTLLPVAVDNLLANASVDYTTRVLEYTLHSPDPLFRLAAAKGLGTLGTPQALKLLAKSANDPDHEVRIASERGSASIRRALGDGKPLSVKIMATLFKDHVYWSEKLDHLSAAEFKAAARKLIEYEHSMTEIVNSQMTLRNSFPEIWCTKCNARSEEKRYARWRYVHCRRCLDVMDLKVNIQHVAGRIGEREERPLDKRELVLQLWDESRQTAVFAEIDHMEICEDRITNLDWAINAVVGSILEHWPDRKSPIPVYLIGKPKLSENAVQLLRQINPEFSPGS